MKQLSDLLDEVKAGAPPARYDVDDVVAAGKRRQRRRASGWAAVAAVAVAVAIGVPRIASLQAQPEPALPPAATATITPEFTFTGYAVGKLRVEDPSEWNLAGETANIRRAGSSESVGTLKVYHPGVDPVPGGYRQQPAATDVKPAGGRRVFEVPLGPGYPVNRAVRIGWEYADGAVATVEGDLTRAELKRVAESFATGRRRPVTLAFRSSSLPAGYHVVSITSTTGGVVRSEALLVTADQVAARLARPAREASPADPKGSVSISLTAGPEIDVPAEPACDGIVCETPVAGGVARLGVGSRNLGAEAIRRAIEDIEVADPAAPATWWPVVDAIGASAMPPAK